MTQVSSTTLTTLIHLCTEDKMLSLITSLDTSKSTGADSVSAKILKSTAPFIAKSLTKLFNKFLRSGKFPSDWKVARVVPILKGGDPESPANYRPISIPSILSQGNPQPQLSSPIHTTARKHLIVGMRYAQCFLTSAKRLILSPISNFYTNFLNSKSILSS